jgi:hypothetical protein
VAIDPDTRLVYRLLLAVDVEKYSKRNALEQFRAQEDLRRALEDTASLCGLNREVWHKQVRGDGELAVLPPDVDVPHVVGTFVCHLETVLADLNTARIGRRRLRLRLAMHHGTLAPGPFGPIGDAPVVVSRLLDAAPVRRHLAGLQDGDLALVVSDEIFKNVVSTGFCAFGPADFEAIRVTTKGDCYRGYIRRSRAVSADATVLTLSSRRYASLT